MSNVIDEFLVAFGWEVDKKSISGAKSALAEAAGFATKMALMIKGASMAVQGFIMKTAEGMDELGNAASRAGTDIETLDRLGYQATLNGSSQDALNASLQTLNIALGQAAQGMGRGKAAFEAVGISAKKSNGEIKTSTEVLEELQRKMQGMSKTEAQGVAQRLGLDSTLIEMLTGDMSELNKEYATFTKISGLSLEQGQEASASFMDEMDRTKKFMQMLWRAISIDFIKKLSDFFIRARKWLIDNSDEVKYWVNLVIQIISWASNLISTVVTRIAKYIGMLKDKFEALDPASKKAVLAIAAIGAALIILGKDGIKFLLSPVGLIIAAMTALALLYDDFRVWREGGKSMFDWSKYAPTIEAVENAVSTTFAAIIKWTGIAIEFCENHTDALLKAAEAVLALWIAWKGYTVWKSAQKLIPVLIDNMDTLIIKSMYAKDAFMKAADVVGAGLKTMGSAFLRFGTYLISTVIPAVWSFTAALLTNPITWVVVLIIGLCAALYLLWKHWDQVKAAVVSWWASFTGILSKAKDAIASALAAPIAFVQAKWEVFCGWLSDKFQWMLGIADKIKSVLGGAGGASIQLAAANGGRLAGGGSRGGSYLSGSSPSRSGGGGNSRTEQNDNRTYNVKTEIRVDGAKDPKAVAKEIQQTQGSTARNLSSATPAFSRKR